MLQLDSIESFAGSGGSSGNCVSHSYGLLIRTVNQGFSDNNPNIGTTYAQEISCDKGGSVE